MTAENLTPYDTGERLEPHVWVRDASPGEQPRKPGDYGKVDFDDEESTTALTVHAEHNEDKTYTLHIENISVGLKMKVESEDIMTVTPTQELQTQVFETIRELRTSTEQEVAEVYWQNGQALILVAGEIGYRKQQAIIVHEPGNRFAKTSSAKVGNWGNGVRDTRIG